MNTTQHTIVLTTTALDELWFKCEVTRDDHGDGTEACRWCHADDRDEHGVCDRSKEAAGVMRAINNGKRLARGKRLTLTDAEVTYAIGELENAADICDDNVSNSYGGERMGFMASSRSYRSAAERLAALLRADV